MTFLIGKACAVTLILVLPSLSFGASPNSWHDLNLRETTSAQAIAILGSPTKDQKTELGKLGSIILPLRTFVDPEHKHDAARVLVFSRVKSFRSVGLGFVNDKLILIELAPDKENVIEDEDLKTTYPDCVFADATSGSLITSMMGYSESTTAGVMAALSSPPFSSQLRVAVLLLFDSVTFPDGRVGKAKKSLQ